MAARILIVDDDALMCKLLHMTLSRDGYESHEVYSGPAALEYIEEHDVDLILLDVMMADINGFEVVRRLKDNERSRDIPVILLTARVDAISQKLGLDIGAVDYLTKPITPDKLSERVRVVLAPES